MTNPNQLCDVLLFVCSKMADETNLSSCVVTHGPKDIRTIEDRLYVVHCSSGHKKVKKKKKTEKEGHVMLKKICSGFECGPQREKQF